METIEQERVKQRTAKQIVHVPVPQIQEQSAVTGLVNPQISITAVEASQVVGSFPLSEDFAALGQAQVIVQEISEVVVVERIQEQIVETTRAFPTVHHCTNYASRDS